MTHSINLYDRSKDSPRRSWTFVVWIGLPLALATTLISLSYYQRLQISMLEQQIESAGCANGGIEGQMAGLTGRTIIQRGDSG